MISLSETNQSSMICTVQPGLSNQWPVGASPAMAPFYHTAQPSLVFDKSYRFLRGSQLCSGSAVLQVCAFDVSHSGCSCAVLKIVLACERAPEHRWPFVQMSNVHPDVAYHALAESPTDATDASQPFLKSDTRKDEHEALPKLQMLAYAGIRSSERKSAKVAVMACFALW